MVVFSVSLKAFIFDLDGVITDTALYHKQAWHYLANQHSLHFTEELNEQLKGISRSESLEMILDYNQVKNQFSYDDKEKMMNLKNEYYVALIKKMTQNDYLPGIESLLKGIKKEGYLLALASASKNAKLILNLLNATNYFDYIVNPNHIKRGKPAPDLFLNAAEYFSILPRECIGVEDASSGIRAINEAGMFSVGVGNKFSLQDAHVYFESTVQIDLDFIIKKYNHYIKDE